MADVPDSFTHRYVPALGRRVHRLGLAANYGIDGAGVRSALEQGINYIFATNFGGRALLEPLREGLNKDRESLVLAAGPTLAYWGGSIRRGTEALLRKFKTEYIDVLQIFWLGVMSAWTASTVRELVQLRAEGKVRAIGASIHDRPRAGRLAEDSPLDLLMIRYNAAHPGAERDIFPFAQRRRPAIVAYTATRWGKLLKRPKGWDGPAMTAGDCYRFCLSHPQVDVVLTGPASQRELAENLASLNQGPLQPAEEERMRRFGAAVHG